jgi:hypothetical protein
VKKLALALAAILGVILISGGVSYAASAYRTGTTAATTASQPGTYGACVNLKNGYVRILERTDLSKSRYGACAQDGSEKFITFPSSASGGAQGASAYDTWKKYHPRTNGHASTERDFLASLKGGFPQDITVAVPVDGTIYTTTCHDRYADAVAKYLCAEPTKSPVRPTSSPSPTSSAS